jgi:gluconolactonase
MHPYRASRLGLVVVAAVSCKGNDQSSPTGDASGAPPLLDGAAPRDAGADGAVVPNDAAAIDGAPADARATWSCPPGPYGNPLPSGAHAELVAGVPPADGVVNGDGVLEGPVWIDGALYMTHFENRSVPPSRILRWSASDGVSIVNASSWANGLAVDANGALVAAIHADGSISRFTGATTGTAPTQSLASSYGGKRFDSPNDLAIRADGNIYFSDPDWQSPTPHPQAKTRVYRINPAGTVSLIDDQLNEPNGVTLSPDGSRLYISGLSGVFAYDVAADGSVSGKRTFAANLESDGMGIDCAGNLYVTYQASIVVLRPDGTELGRIPVDGVESVTNVAFGGADRKTLFVTSLGSTQHLSRVVLGVPGMPY